uniref:N-acetylglucosamine kinase n=1 Tax=Nonomuraea bangladeshensis TaxID=404385 RepID=UPI003F4971E3
MRRWVAVDGGQSGLRLRWNGGEGSSSGYVHGSDGVEATIKAVRHAADRAGFGLGADVICLGLSGYPRDPRTAVELARGVADCIGATEVQLCQDMVTAHAGALSSRPGIVLAAGTGTVCLAVRADGTYRKVDGAGYLFGDAGSGFALGRAGLTAVVRARDHRGPATSLSQNLPTAPEDLYSSRALVAEVAAFAPAVLAHSAAGDLVARRIVEEAVAELATTITAASAWMGEPGPIPVACVGGLFAAGTQMLDPLSERLPPTALLVAPAGTPLDGAERLAQTSKHPYADLIQHHRFPS